MAKAKKKLLPKDFETLLASGLASGDLEPVKAVFATCDVNARGGTTKQTALAYNDCPDEIVRWLVEQGADLSAVDTYGETPLHARAGHWRGNIEILLELGADVHHGENQRGTPLHEAAGTGNVRTARLLLEHGARAEALNSRGQTPLIYALQRCNNGQIEAVAGIAALLLDAMGRQAAETAIPKPRKLIDRVFGRHRDDETPVTPVTPEMKALVQRIGTNFEFHRAGFNPDSVEATSAALDKLYALFDVPPVPRRTMHDGSSPIVATAARWQDQHQELWALLVPSSGAASTVQGEVVRISGRIGDELDRNGGANWDAAYRKMANAFLQHIGSGVPLPDAALGDARKIMAEIGSGGGDTQRLCSLAVEWVALNPEPQKLPAPAYHR